MALFLIVLIMLSINPLIGYINELNGNINFPSSLAGLENTMRLLEEQAKIQTNAFLSTKNIGGLLLNILIIGVIAAVGEEIVFRGLLQNIFYRWTNNIHAGIWIAAFLFSFIHFQFFGFFPRLLLGALLGYLYAWSGSLWSAIGGHFINNTAAVIAYFLVNKNLLGQNVTEEATLLQALISIPFLAVFIFLYKRISQLKRSDVERLNSDYSTNKESGFD